MHVCTSDKPQVAWRAWCTNPAAADTTKNTLAYVTVPCERTANARTRDRIESSTSGVATPGLGRIWCAGGHGFDASENALAVAAAHATTEMGRAGGAANGWARVARCMYARRIQLIANCVQSVLRSGQRSIAAHVCDVNPSLCGQCYYRWNMKTTMSYIRGGRDISSRMLLAFFFLILIDSGTTITWIKSTVQCVYKPYKRQSMFIFPAIILVYYYHT